jgi:tetratricopeptide (TPR) repeat protein
MDNIAQQHAMVLFEQAYRLHMKGHLGEAIELYKKSLEICPTAEACTFLGWGYSMVGRYDEAIEWCKQAISLDPDFGNPYNDIGSYLVETGRPQEALPWLEKATLAPRYDARHFPYLNMGRAHEKLGQYRSAVEAYDAALAVTPLYLPAHWAKYGLLAKMN